jgi:hypothetical protein
VSLSTFDDFHSLIESNCVLVLGPILTLVLGDMVVGHIDLTSHNEEEAGNNKETQRISPIMSFSSAQTSWA